MSDVYLNIQQQPANKVLAGPASGSSAFPTYRSLTSADLPAGTGTVTYVGLSLPASVFSVTNSPVTGSATLIGSFLTQTAHTVFAGPTIGTAVPGFRALQLGDLPSGNLTDSTSGSDGIVITGGTGALLQSASIAQTQASGSTNGYLSSTDWTTFNGKGSGTVISVQATTNSISGLTVTGGPITGSGTLAFTLAQATSIASGYLSSTDWNTFNNKGSGTVTSVNVTTNSVSGLTVSGVPITGSGTAALTLAQATTSTSGYLSSTDWNTFNNKQSTISIGNLDAQSANAQGLAFVSNVLSQQSATTSFPGLVNNTAQSFSGLKTFTNGLDAGSNTINNVTDPSTAQQAATKNYVDTVASGLQPIQAVTAASTGNVSGTYLNGASGIGATFTTTSTATFVIDGVTPSVGQRILFKNQTSGFQNGVYNFTTAPVGGISGAVFTRSLDYDTPADVNAGNLVPVLQGTTNGSTSWLQTATVTTIGTDALTYVEWTANPANYLLKANNLSDVASATTSFNNISPMTTLGDIIYENATPSGTRLPGNTSATLAVLTQTGNGSISAAPVWTSSTGTGNVVLSASPTLTGTATAANISMSGTLVSSNTTASAVVINSSSFVVDALNNAIGIGIAPAGTAIIDVVNNSGSAKAVQLTGYGSNIGFRGRYANGTSGAPTAAVSGNVISFLSGRGYGSTQFATVATGLIQIVAGETFTNTSNATYVTINTTPTGSVTNSERIRFDIDGRILINTMTNNGIDQLQVNGTGSFTGITNSALSNHQLVAAGASGSLTGITLTNGQLLIGSTGATPVAATLTQGSGITITTAAGSITVAATQSWTASTITGSTNLVTNTIYYVDTSGGAFSVVLPAPTNTTQIKIKDSTGSFHVNNLTIKQNASEKIEGLAASYLATGNWEALEIRSNGTDWFFF